MPARPKGINCLLPAAPCLLFIAHCLLPAANCLAVTPLDPSGNTPTSDDPLVLQPTLESARGMMKCEENYRLLTAGLCDFGHQGLQDNREFLLWSNRARYGDPRGRWPSRDPGMPSSTQFDIPGLPTPAIPDGIQHDPSLIYRDGPNLYQYASNCPTTVSDPLGLWGEDVHQKNTKSWAIDVGYVENDCAGTIAHACNAVDDMFGGKAPRPGIGDMRYHWDYDYYGFRPEANARQKRADEHFAIAKDLLQYAQWPKTELALIQIGYGLHPLQDVYSHSRAHLADSPFSHAPFVYCCGLLGDCLGMKYPVCIWHRKNNPNWGDPWRPDNVKLWPADVTATKEKTKAVLKEWLDYEPIRCRCAPGLP